MSNKEYRMTNEERLRSESKCIKLDGLVKSPKMPFSVIPVKTGIQEI